MKEDKKELETPEVSAADKILQEIEREVNFYFKSYESSRAKDTTDTVHSYAMINTDSSVASTYDWVSQLLHMDGKNRKLMMQMEGTEIEDISPEAEEVDKYYQTALSIAMNQFLKEQSSSKYYEMYAQVVAIFLISEGMKDMISTIELPEVIKTKTDDVLIELDDNLRELVVIAKDKCRTIQPDLYQKFSDLDINLINEPTSTVITRWFTTDKGVVEIGEEMKVVLQGLRTEFLRYVKRNGKVELATLLRLYDMNPSTYNNYKRDMINKVLPKCDASLMSYVKFLLLQ